MEIYLYVYIMYTYRNVCLNMVVYIYTYSMGSDDGGGLDYGEVYI
jgi:hypothetical protein